MLQQVAALVVAAGLLPAGYALDNGLAITPPMVRAGALVHAPSAVSSFAASPFSHSAAQLGGLGAVTGWRWWPGDGRAGIVRAPAAVPYLISI